MWAGAETAGNPAARSKDMVALLSSIFHCNQYLYLSYVLVPFQQPEPLVKEVPEEVLLRANAKGILDRIGSNQQLSRKEKHGHANKTSKQASAHPSQTHLSVNIRCKNQETKAAGGTASNGHHESSNRRQLSQGGHYYFRASVSYEAIDRAKRTISLVSAFSLEAEKLIYALYHYPSPYFVNAACTYKI